MESLSLTQHLPDLSWADKVAYLAWKFRELAPFLGGEDSIPVTHSFEPGVYIREMCIPGDRLFIGRTHIKGHFCELVSGRLILYLEHGSLEYEAPAAIKTTPGFQTVLRTITPCLVRTIHQNPDNSQDLAELELDAFQPTEPILQRGEQIAAELRGLLK
jgi:hypothetical protein